MDGGTLALKLLEQPLEGFCTLNTLQNIIYTLQNLEIYHSQSPRFSVG